MPLQVDSTCFFEATDASVPEYVRVVAAESRAEGHIYTIESPARGQVHEQVLGNRLYKLPGGTRANRMERALVHELTPQGCTASITGGPTGRPETFDLQWSVLHPSRLEQTDEEAQLKYSFDRASVRRARGPPWSEVKLRIGTPLEIQVASIVNGNGEAPPKGSIVGPELVRFTADDRSPFACCVAHRSSQLECFAHGNGWCDRHPVLQQRWPEDVPDVTRTSWASCSDFCAAWLPLLWMETVTSSLKADTHRLRVETTVVMWEFGQDIKGTFHVGKRALKQLFPDVLPLTALVCIQCLHERGIWLGHGLLSTKTKEEDDESEDDDAGSDKEDEQDNDIPRAIPFTLLQACGARAPAEYGVNHFTLELIRLPYPCLAQLQSLHMFEQYETELARQMMGAVILRAECPRTPLVAQNIDATMETQCRGRLNHSQNLALDGIKTKPCCLIQGPPGTGKSRTIAHISLLIAAQPIREGRRRPLILAVAPSNKAADVIAEALLKAKGDLGLQTNLLRVCSVDTERKETPEPIMPNRNRNPRNPRPAAQSGNRVQHSVADVLRPITLHWRVNSPQLSPQNPFVHGLQSLRVQLEQTYDRRSWNVLKKQFDKKLEDAKRWELQQASILIMTCGTAARKSLRTAVKKGTIAPTHLIVDEAGMVLEAEALSPLLLLTGVTGSLTVTPPEDWERVVFVGDHKQLEPVVLNQEAKDKGYGRSLFKRLASRSESLDEHTPGLPLYMLEEQYRMHPQISSFVSSYFYDGRVRDHASVHPGVQQCRALPVLQIRSGQRCERHAVVAIHHEFPEVFEAILGQEQTRQAINSKSNPEEAELAVRVAQYLLQRTSSSQSGPRIAILTWYNAQVNTLLHHLNESGIKDQVHCGTVVTAQGSEWDSVILSLVRSSEEDAPPDATMNWLQTNIGSVSDPHRACVGLSRARINKVVLGNFGTLSADKLWRTWVKHMKDNGAWSEAEHVLDETRWFRVGELVCVIGDSHDGKLGHVVSAASEAGEYKVRLEPDLNEIVSVKGWQLEWCDFKLGQMVRAAGKLCIVSGFASEANSAVLVKLRVLEDGSEMRRPPSEVALLAAGVSAEEQQRRTSPLGQPQPSNFVIELQADDLGFSHRHCSFQFRASRSEPDLQPTVLETLAQVLQDESSFHRLPILRVHWHNGQWYTMGNRRLVVWRLYSLAKRASWQPQPGEAVRFGWPRTRAETMQRLNGHMWDPDWQIKLEDGTVITVKESALFPAEQLKAKVHVASASEASDWGWAEKFNTDNAGRLIELRGAPVQEQWRVGLGHGETTSSLMQCVLGFAQPDR
eukprot:TRINITY_DN59510_c0_g1_i1.p1 TRINITY_DN59510_c0_g1~~TRINITY_DN59510_c0_g1_i1.p1  ORF type:complete len:1326 (-),score=199.22 TRINITY_DN59510_c0_g1_i1:95-4012(-)